MNTERPTKTELAIDLAYDQISQSELFDSLPTNGDIDKAAVDLGAEIEKLMESWIEQRAEETRRKAA